MLRQKFDFNFIVFFSTYSWWRRIMEHKRNGENAREWKQKPCVLDIVKDVFCSSKDTEVKWQEIGKRIRSISIYVWNSASRSLFSTKKTICVNRCCNTAKLSITKAEIKRKVSTLWTQAIWQHHRVAKCESTTLKKDTLRNSNSEYDAVILSLTKCMNLLP